MGVMDFKAGDWAHMDVTTQVAGTCSCVEKCCIACRTIEMWCVGLPLFFLEEWLPINSKTSCLLTLDGSYIYRLLLLPSPRTWFQLTDSGMYEFKMAKSRRNQNIHMHHIYVCTCMSCTFGPTNSPKDSTKLIPLRTVVVPAVAVDGAGVVGSWLILSLFGTWLYLETSMEILSDEGPTPSHWNYCWHQH